LLPPLPAIAATMTEDRAYASALSTQPVTGAELLPGNEEPAGPPTAPRPVLRPTDRPTATGTGNLSRKGTKRQQFSHRTEGTPGEIPRAFDEIVARHKATQNRPTCRHCEKRFDVKDNGPNSCSYHPGSFVRPFFCFTLLCLKDCFDAEPHWSCCGDIDQFVGPCKRGPHKA